MKSVFAVALVLGGLTSAGIWAGIQAVDNVQQRDTVQIQAGRAQVHSNGHGYKTRNGGNQTTTSCHCY